MTLAVVILNWNQAQDTIACVEAVRAWEFQPKHIWVVDNASQPDDYQSVARAVGRGEASPSNLAGPRVGGDASPQRDIHLIRADANRGFAGGNNIALAQVIEAGCDAVLLLNNDAQVDAPTVRELLRLLQTEPSIGIIGPMLYAADDSGQLLSAGGRDIAHHVSSHILVPVKPGELRTVAYVPGTCVLIRTQVLETAGLFDEAYFFGGEMADLCQRARQAGWTSVISGTGCAKHAIDRSSGIRRRLHTYYVIRNRFLFARKFYPQQRFPLFVRWAAYSAYAWAHAALHQDRDRARAIWMGCMHGWRGVYGGQNAVVTRGEIA